MRHLGNGAHRLPILPYGRDLNQIPSIPGCIDWTTRVSADEFLIRGWMLDPTAELNSIQSYVNGKHAGAAQLVHRPDLDTNISWVPHAARAGFEVRLHPRNISPEGYNHLDLIGYQPRDDFRYRVGRFFGLGNPYGLPVGRYHTLCRPDIDAAPSPPAHLLARVVGHDDLIAFKTGGMKLYGDFLAAMARHRDPRSVRRILDWGCGCGRATVHFLNHLTELEVHGCDIDGEAIAWCRANLSAGIFAAIGPMPPLPYSDGYFDAIVSCSVFSHLKRDVQHLWLAELTRVLTPGGLLLASIHGMFAATITYPPARADVVRLAGIVDDTPDFALGDVTELGYYTSTFQTREYTLREWSKHLWIVDYIEAGMHNYQDLVVMRKRAT